MMHNQTPCFGIDLGTSCSTIGVVLDGAPMLIEVDGGKLMPSVVTILDDTPPMIGQMALNSLQVLPERTVISSKRKIGTQHQYQIPWKGRWLNPTDVAGLILGRLLNAAESQLGIRPKRAVITVPAWFTQPQRSATRRAGELAGLEVARIINEPTAAALAYAHDANVKRRVLVYDLGGGTFDVSLVEQCGNIVEVRASHGNNELGGDDIDVILRDRLLRNLDEKDRDLVDAIAASPGAMLRLRVAVEEAKITLSTQPSANISLPFLVSVQGKERHLETSLSQKDLDMAAGFVLSHTIEPVHEVLKAAGIQAAEVDELLLVGGSTLLPQVWRLLHETFDLEGSHGVPPRRAVAMGAAIQGAIIDGVQTGSVLIDVAPFSISVGFIEERVDTSNKHFVCRVLTPRNTPLPARHVERFYTASSEQKFFQIPLFQGSAPDPRENVFLGYISFPKLIEVENVEHRPILVEIFHDLNGMLEVRATDEASGQQVSGHFNAEGEEQDSLRDQWIDRMTRNGVVFGDGSSARDTTPNPADQEDSSRHLQARLEARLEAAKKHFKQLLNASNQLQEECPEEAPALLQLAEYGLQQIEEDAIDAAFATLEESEDLMFEAGFYL